MNNNEIIVKSKPDTVEVLKTDKTLSAATLARIERNRQKALLLRESRLVEKSKNETVNSGCSYRLQVKI